MSPAHAPAPDRGTARGFWTLFEREIVRVLKIWSQTIGAPVLTGLLYFAVFGVAVGERIGEVDGHPYLTYIVPGVVLMQIALTAYSNTSSSIFQAKSDAYIEDVLTAPMHAWQVSLAIVLGGVVRALVIGWIVLAASLLFTDVPFTHPIESIVLSVAVAVLWASIGMIAGTYAQTFDQHMLIANLVITPLVFVGGVFYSVEMLPAHLELFTRLDPLFYQVNGLRHSLLGTSDASFWAAMLSTIALAVVSFTIQIWLFTTGRRLKA